MRIAVPRERKQGECRIALTPKGAQRLAQQGHSVLIEKSAGEKSGFFDDEYLAAGAKITSSLETIWCESDLVVKVKEPAAEEIPFFGPNLSVFCFLHHAAFPELTDKMLESGMTGIDYDLVTLSDGSLPILRPMSIIAGKLSIQCGALALQSNMSGRGVLLGGTDTVAPARVLVIGAGAAGSSAALVAHGMGAEVVVLDINQKKLDALPKSTKLHTAHSNEKTIRLEITSADLIIGSVLIPGDKAPKLVKADMLPTMKKGAVFVDICIDQGGCAETSRSTSIAEPTYVEQNVVHYCVPNMPALVPRTATEALTNETIGYIEALANKGIKQALRESKPLFQALTVYSGKLTNKTIGLALKITALEEQETRNMLNAK